MLITTKSGSFELTEDESLLEALEKNGYTVEYQCRSGYCGACRLKVERGQVAYNTPPLAFLYPDEILPCCCVVTENLSLDVRHSNPNNVVQKDLFDGKQLVELVPRTKIQEE